MDRDCLRRKAGRPFVPIDKDLFEYRCSIGFSTAALVDAFGCSDSTLRRWVKRTYGKAYETVYKSLQTAGIKTKLYENMIKLSDKKPAVLIFALKNFCGLSDQPAPQATGERSQTLASAIAKAVKAFNAGGVDDIFENPSQSIQSAERPDQ